MNKVAPKKGAAAGAKKRSKSLATDGTGTRPRQGGLRRIGDVIRPVVRHLQSLLEAAYE